MTVYRFLVPVLGACLLMIGCAGDSDTPTTRCVNCDGCCQNGMCMGGNTPQACGTNGAQCISCPSGQTCVQGQCSSETTCGPSNCSGCCYQNQCLDFSRQTYTVCGTGGAQCQACATGQCVNGQCQSGSCNATNCNGCCSPQGNCIPFASQTGQACGTSGQLCQSCPTNQCVNGQCVSGACSASNCQGCCTPQGSCIPFASQNAQSCGTSGQLCQSCGTGQCVNGACSGSSCTSTTCAQGCCTTSDQCVLYAQQNASICGTSGQLCQSCGSGQCQEGQCKNCSNVTCPTGCCNAQGNCIIKELQNAQNCGLSGNTCQQCTGTTNACVDGLCSVAWKVMVVSAAVTEKGEDWDGQYTISGPEPDPFVEVVVNASGKMGITNFIDDTFNPTFNQEVLTESQTALTDAKGLTITVREDDGFIDETMGTCNVTVTLSHLQAGNLTVTSCNNNVTEVRLKFYK